MKEIEFIVTFNDSPQQFFNYDYNEDALQDEQSLFDYATQELDNEDVDEIVKISTCVYGVTPDDLPSWFMDCNGKLWAEDGAVIY